MVAFPQFKTNPNAGDFFFSQMESQLSQQLSISFVSSLLSNREELVFEIKVRNLKIDLKQMLYASDLYYPNCIILINIMKREYYLIQVWFMYY